MQFSIRANNYYYDCGGVALVGSVFMSPTGTWHFLFVFYYMCALLIFVSIPYYLLDHY